MPDAERLVLDTNVVVSGMLFCGAVPGRVLMKAQSHHVLASEATLLELVEVMNRNRFDRYVEAEVRRQLVVAYMNACETVEITSSIRADAIVSGDQYLLALHPFRGIAILAPAEYLGRE